MTKNTKTEALSRRKLLGRIGVLAAASYSIPAFTTLSVAQAGSGASGGGGSAPSAESAPSNGPSNGPSVAPAGTGAPAQTDTTGPTALDVCGPENLNDAAYLQCLVTNGF